MDERLRNMFGFMLVALIIGAIGISWYCLNQHRRPSGWKSLGLLGGLAVLGAVVFWFAGLFEMPCAYAFTIWRMRGAISANGVPISKIIEKDGSHWITDDYFAYFCCPDQDYLITMRLETPENSTDLYFEYESRTRVVVPITDLAAETFPELMPKGDKLVNHSDLIYGTNPSHIGPMSIGHSNFKLPVNWFRSVTNRESLRSKP